MAYLTLSELKGALGIGDTGDDATLQRALDAAEEQVNAWTGRRFAADGSPTVRYYDALTPSLVTVDPLSSLTGLAVAVDRDGDGDYEENLVVDVGYRVDPYNAAVVGAPWTTLAALAGTTFPQGARRVRVEARYGWPAVPASVKQAVLIQAERLWKRKDAPFGVAGSPEFGSELRLLATLDPDVQSLLRPYRALWAAV